MTRAVIDVCNPSVSGSGGEEQFRRGPGLASPRRSQQDRKAADLTSETDASGRHGDATLDVQSESVGVVPGHCSRPGEDSHELELY
jgi:hypothetical protein